MPYPSATTFPGVTTFPGLTTVLPPIGAIEVRAAAATVIEARSKTTAAVEVR